MSDQHGPDADLGFATAVEQIAMVQQSQISASELVATMTHRISAVDDSSDGIRSVLAISADAMAQAEALQTSASPLHGIPVMIKDNIEAVGLPCTAGSLALAGRPVVADAPLVANLRRAGAVVLGSTNLSEWANIRSAHSASGWSAVGGLTANPWKRSRSAGGSSSGSGAAVAAGLIAFAVGTETDGSIVCPASLNGVVGIKPTVSAVSTRGVVPISASQDSPGPLARTVTDAAMLLDVLAGTDTMGALKATDPVRVGVVRQWLTTDDSTSAVFEEAIRTLSAAGIRCIDVDVPADTDQAEADEGTVLFHELVEDLGAYLAARPGAGVQSLADVVKFNDDHADIELAHFGQDRFEVALTSGGRNAKYFQARARNLEWAVNQVLGPALHDVDVLIGCLYRPAWVSDLEHGDDFQGSSWMTMAPAIAGWPLASVPMGFVDGLPVGLGIAARPHDEVGLVRAMYRIEQALGLGVVRPSFLA